LVGPYSYLFGNCGSFGWVFTAVTVDIRRERTRSGTVVALEKWPLRSPVRLRPAQDDEAKV
jgi:hypothetical protein